MIRVCSCSENSLFDMLSWPLPGLPIGEEVNQSNLGPLSNRDHVPKGRFHAIRLDRRFASPSWIRVAFHTSQDWRGTAAACECRASHGEGDPAWFCKPDNCRSRRILAPAALSDISKWSIGHPRRLSVAIIRTSKAVVPRKSGGPYHSKFDSEPIATSPGACEQSV